MLAAASEAPISSNSCSCTLCRCPLPSPPHLLRPPSPPHPPDAGPAPQQRTHLRHKARQPPQRGRALLAGQPQPASQPRPGGHLAIAAAAEGSGNGRVGAGGGGAYGQLGSRAQRASGSGSAPGMEARVGAVRTTGQQAADAISREERGGGGGYQPSWWSAGQHVGQAGGAIWPWAACCSCPLHVAASKRRCSTVGTHRADDDSSSLATHLDRTLSSVLLPLPDGPITASTSPAQQCPGSGRGGGQRHGTNALVAFAAVAVQQWTHWGEAGS